MNKLLSANFFRLRKNKCFRGSLAFMFVIGIAMELKGLIREALIKMILGFDIALEIEEE